MKLAESTSTLAFVMAGERSENACCSCLYRKHCACLFSSPRCKLQCTLIQSRDIILLRDSRKTDLEVSQFKDLQRCKFPTMIKRFGKTNIREILPFADPLFYSTALKPAR